MKNQRLANQTMDLMLKNRNLAIDNNNNIAKYTQLTQIWFGSTLDSD